MKVHTQRAKRAYKKILKSLEHTDLVDGLQALREHCREHKFSYRSLMNAGKALYKRGEYHAATRIWSHVLRCQLKRKPMKDTHRIIRNFLHELLVLIQGEGHSLAEYDFRTDHINWCIEYIDEQHGCNFSLPPAHSTDADEDTCTNADADTSADSASDEQLCAYIELLLLPELPPRH